MVRKKGLASRLTPRLERDEVPGYRLAQLLPDLTDRGAERIFVVRELAFGNRPCALVLLGPEGAPGMHQ